MRPDNVSNHSIFLAWLDKKQRRYQGKMDKQLKIKFYERNQVDN